jgi:hypothetical protein
VLDRRVWGIGKDAQWADISYRIFCLLRRRSGVGRDRKFMRQITEARHDDTPRKYQFCSQSWLLHLGGSHPYLCFQAVFDVASAISSSGQAAQARDLDRGA